MRWAATAGRGNTGIDVGVGVSFSDGSISDGDKEPAKEGGGGFGASAGGRTHNGWGRGGDRVDTPKGVNVNNFLRLLTKRESQIGSLCGECTELSSHVERVMGLCWRDHESRNGPRSS